MVIREQVDSWVDEALAKENLKDYKIVISGSSEKGEGFLGDIIFIEIEGITQKDVSKRFYFVVKHAKPSEKFRKTLPINLIFENEILLYTGVILAFQKFQREKELEDVFDCVAKCYYSSCSGDMEVLVLDNLKKKGYELFDKNKTMNLNHCKAILEQYGKFHALSFAMRHQKKDIFSDLVSRLHDVPMKMMERDEVAMYVDDSKLFALDMLKKNGDDELHEKLLKLLHKGAHAILMETLNFKESQSVITHGDNWCNNFLFKYDGDTKDQPSELAIIDFQLSSLRSPVFDLSNFIYAVCSKTELEFFEELLKFYYDSFSTHLRNLGDDPEELFSYSDLKRHWRKYSIFGLINTIGALRFILTDKETVPSLEDVTEDLHIVDMFKNIKYNTEILYNRTKGVVWHYLNFLDNEF